MRPCRQGYWDEWSACSKPCGEGQQIRRYVVDAPAEHGGETCGWAHGAPRTRACNLQPCRINCQGWGPGLPHVARRAIIVSTPYLPPTYPLSTPYLLPIYPPSTPYLHPTYSLSTPCLRPIAHSTSSFVERNGIL